MRFLLFVAVLLIAMVQSQDTQDFQPLSYQPATQYGAQNAVQTSPFQQIVRYGPKQTLAPPSPFQLVINYGPDSAPAVAPGQSYYGPVQSAAVTSQPVVAPVQSYYGPVQPAVAVTQDYSTAPMVVSGQSYYGPVQPTVVVTQPAVTQQVQTVSPYQFITQYGSAPVQSVAARSVVAARPAVTPVSPARRVPEGCVYIPRQRRFRCQTRVRVPQSSGASAFLKFLLARTLIPHGGSLEW